MDFTNDKFLAELTSVRRRIVPSGNSTSSVSTDSIELCTVYKNENDNDTENNYINLETFSSIDNNTNNDSSVQISRPNRNTLFNETNLDSLGNFNLQRAFEILNKTLELNNSLVNKYNENNNSCCQTVTIMILTSAYLLGLIILNDYILLTYFINRE
jgi:hypothetical protein